MRLYKENIVGAVPFYQSVQDLAHTRNSRRNQPQQQEIAGSNMLEKYSFLFQTLVAFDKDIEHINNRKEVFSIFRAALKRILPYKECALLEFNKPNDGLIAIDKSEDAKDLETTINTYLRDGILVQLFEQPRPMMFPHLGAYDIRGVKLNFLLIPIIEDYKQKGVFAILTPSSDKQIHQPDRQLIEVLTKTYLRKVERLEVKSKMKSMYEDLQTYQAKLSNDFRLSAIGELTEGIVDEILSPLQVIMSQVDMLNADAENSSEVKRIKAQINKINSVISRLVKFSSMNKQDVVIQSVNLNDVIGDYHHLIKSSLDNLKLECVLDFEKGIPPILSHPNYIHHILANIFGMIRSARKEEIGLVLQTRYQNEAIVVKVVSTSDLHRSLGNGKESKQQSSLATKIVENLMKKHEGSFEVQAFEDSGSQIVLTFPLRRKVRA